MLSEQPVANTNQNSLFMDADHVQTVPTVAPDLREVRWLFFAGNCVTQDELAQYADDIGNGHSAWWQHGGMPCTVPGLYRSHYFIARGRFVPLEMGLEHVPADYVTETGGGAPVVKVFQTPNIGVGDGRMPGRLMGPQDPSLASIERFPGEYINGLLTSQKAGSMRYDIGLVELTAFKGLDPKKPEERALVERVHNFFFPEFPELPPTLSGLETLIQEGLQRAKTAGELQTTLQSVGQAMLRSCRMYRTYANSEIESNESWIRAQSGNTNIQAGYWPITTTLMQQMGRQPSQRLTDAIVPDMREATAPSVNLQDLLSVIQQTNAATDAKFMTLLEALVASKSGTGEPAVAPTPTPAAPEKDLGRSIRAKEQWEKRRAAQASFSVSE